MLTLNLLEVPKERELEEGVIQAAALPRHRGDTGGCSVLGYSIGTG